MRHSSYLENDENELLKERASLGKSDIILVLTNNRVIFIKNNSEIINFFKYSQISKIQNSKPSDKKIDENSIAKIRIIDQKGIKTDLSFKGLESVNKSKKVTSLINKQKKEAQKNISEEKDLEEKQDSQQPDQTINPDMNKNVNKKYMTDNTLKSSFLEKNTAAKTMFKDLVVEEQILTEDEFWNNFKSELAEQKTLYQKNGYIFVDDLSTIELTDNNSNNNNTNDQVNDENEKSSIAIPKIEVNLPDLNAIKKEQEIGDNSEFKPSISIQQTSAPGLPDEDGYITYLDNKKQDQNEDLNSENIENNEEDNDDFDDQNFVWYQEVVEPLPVNPDEFRVEAERFHSNFENFVLSFDSLPEIPLPPMKDAKSIINEISNENYRRFNYQNINNSEIIAGLDVLRNHKMEQQILLVHFWQNYENIENQRSREKALRLRNKMNELQEIIKSERANVKSKEACRALFPLYDEMEKSINKVLGLKIPNK